MNLRCFGHGGYYRSFPPQSGMLAAEWPHPWAPELSPAGTPTATGEQKGSCLIYLYAALQLIPWLHCPHSPKLNVPQALTAGTASSVPTLNSMSKGARPCGCQALNPVYQSLGSLLLWALASVHCMALQGGEVRCQELPGQLLGRGHHLQWLPSPLKLPDTRTGTHQHSVAPK